MLRRLLLRCRALVFRARVEAEFDEELGYHVEREIERHLARGLDPKEARRTVLRAFGDPFVLKEEARETWRWRWLDEIAQDVRYSMRSLTGQPAFTAMTLLALVVGIGVNTGLFNAINALLLRPWDVSDATSVVQLQSAHPRFGFGGLPIASAAYFTEHSRTIDAAFARRFHRTELSAPATRRPVQMELASSAYFDVLRPGIVAGRTFTPGDDDPRAAAAVAVISNVLWREAFGGAPDAVGQTLRLEGVTFTVIGVADAGFAGTGGNRTDVWVPIAAMTLLRPLDSGNLARLTDPEFCCTDVYARLSHGATHEQAVAELSTLFRGFSEGAAQDRIGIAVWGTAVFDHPEERQRLIPTLAITLAAVAAILLLACANVSNMLLARGGARQREIAVRMAIGAGRARVIRQLLTEGLVLAAIAALVSLLVAPALPGLVMRLRDEPLPTSVDFQPDGTVLVYALAISLVAVLAFGLAPAFRSTRVSTGHTLKEHSAQISARFPLERVLITVQVSVSVGLLVAAGLLQRGVEHAESLDPGFRTTGVTALRVQLPRDRYDRTRERAFFDELHTRLEFAAGPIGMAAVMPLSEVENYTDFVVPGTHVDAGLMAVEEVTPEYFDLLGIPIVRGRTFLQSDREAGSILVNESLADLYWPGGTAVGKAVMISERARQIVGVVRDAQLHGIGSTRPMYFAAFSANSQGVGAPPVILAPAAAAAGVAAAVRSAEADAGIETIALSDQARQSLGDARGAARVASVLGWVALLLAASGVYGIISYSVERRRREIMIRVALGASPRSVARLVLGRNALPLAAGVIAGAVLATVAAFVLRSRLYGLNPLDPVTLLGAAMVLLCAGAAASVFPVLRAVRLDPVTALHEE